MFCNRRGDRLKILYWDRDGWAIWYKRLEVGTFQFPFAETGRKEIAAWELGLLLEGIDLSKGQRRKRYSLPTGRQRARRRLDRKQSLKLLNHDSWTGIDAQGCDLPYRAGFGFGLRLLVPPRHETSGNGS